MSHAAPRRLLLVEDEAMVRRLLVRHFHRQGVIVVDTGDAESALEAYRINEFDAVITDVHLPRMNGIELALAMREIRPDQPIIFITGDVDEQLAGQALAHEGTGYLVKPFEFFELDAAVKQAVATRARPRSAAGPAPVQDQPVADWRVQQLRLLEAAARQPVELGLRLAPPRPRRSQARVLVIIGVAAALLVLMAWGIGFFLGGEREELPPAQPSAREPARTIYLPPAPNNEPRDRPESSRR